MRLSISSIVITICMSTVLIFFFNYMISNTNKFKIFRTDFLSFLILIIILRIIFPFEFPFTITIVAQNFMNPLFSLLKKEILFDVNLSQILFLIWLIGILYLSVKLSHIHRCSAQIVKRIKLKSSIHNASEFINTTIGKKYTVMVSDLVKSPMIFGFNNIIFLPDIVLSEKEIKNVLYHEIQHIKNHDTFIKLIINALVVVYWWFPPIYSFRRNINSFLEVRVDDQVTSKMSSEERLDYAATLISIQKKIKSKDNNFSTSVFFINDSDNILSFRINYLLDGAFLKRTNPIFLLILCIIPFISNGIILEPAYYNSHLLKDTVNSQSLNDKGYIVQHKDGTYTLIYNGESAYLGKSIPKELSDISIIKESEAKP